MKTAFLLILLSTAILTAQTAPANPVKIYNVGNDVTAPELLPRTLASMVPADCQGTEPGEVQFAFVVDDTGRPHNIVFVRPLGNDLDRLALAVVRTDQFSPGRRAGVAVPVAMLINLKLEGCVTQETDETGNQIVRLHMRSEPGQQLSPNKDALPNAVLHEIIPQLSNRDPVRIGRGVSAPIPILTPKAPFPKKHQLEGVCLISLIIDANGMPQYPRVTRSLSPEMDKSALEAVERYRFKPALKDGQPVPVEMSIVVNFRH